MSVQLATTGAGAPSERSVDSSPTALRMKGCNELLSPAC